MRGHPPTISPRCCRMPGSTCPQASKPNCSPIIATAPPRPSRPSTAPAFLRAYRLLGAQRATKLLGIFTRLGRRDGKRAYLQHLPRIGRYLRAKSRPTLILAR